MSKEKLKDRVYVLKGDKKPLSYMLQSRNKRTAPLLYFDGESNRALRYASNQKSIYEDEQDGNAVLTPITFEDGALVVPRTNPVLQEFLSKHPGMNNIYEELDHERDADKEIADFEIEQKAVNIILGLGVDAMEDLGRIILESDVRNMPFKILKRDLLIHARTYPEEVIEAMDDPEMEDKSIVAKIFEQNLMFTKNNGTELHWNLSNNKKKLISIPFGQSKEEALFAFFKTADGIEPMKILKKLLE